MVGFGWWCCAKLWYNVRNEVVAQLQDQPVLPSDQPHCQPRVLPLNDEEKTRFVERLWRVATFSYVEVLAYCFMSNHFHILVYVPDPRELSDDELLARIRARNTPLSSPYTTESGQCSRLKVYVPSNRRRDRRSGSTRPASQGRSEAERDVSGRYKPV